MPISKGSGEDHETVMNKVDEITKTLKKLGVRVKVDDRNHLRPGT